MTVIERSPSEASAAVVPLSELRGLRFVFPAEEILFRSRGIDRTEAMPTRFYHTATGVWKTDDVDLMRLLHNDISFLLQTVAQIDSDTIFVAGSTNYGSNPYYCIRHPLPTRGLDLFYLEQETLAEEHSAFSFRANRSGRPCLESLRVALTDECPTCIAAADRPIPDDALVFSAPAIVWNGQFVGWERYTRETYDCRHVVALQYLGLANRSLDQERIRAEIQRLQTFWSERDRYVKEVLDAAETVGYASYERLMLALGGSDDGRYVALWSGKGTAVEVAQRMIAEFPSLEAALQITEGGGTAIVTGTGRSDWRVLGPSSYRRGRILCCLLLEVAAQLP